MNGFSVSSERIYISVILPLRLEWEPCYGVPAGMEGKEGPGKTVTAGDRVLVTFAGKKYIGVVSATGIRPEIEHTRIKDVTETATGLERIGMKEIGLWRQVASYYMCSVGEVYKAAYPMQKISSEGALARRDERIKKRKEAVLEAAVRKLLMVKTRQEKVIRSLSSANESLQSRAGQKTVLLSKAGKDSVRKKYTSELEKIRNSIASNDIAIRSAEKEMERIDKEITELQNRKDSLLKNRGTENCSSDMPQKAREAVIPGFVLTSSQSEALGAIKKAFIHHKTALLKGVTGSGKTEIYITLAAEVMSGGKNVLYLVPEIALSKQLEERLENVFGDSLLTFHSGETMARKAEVSAAVRDITRRQTHETAAPYIVIGTRSALFLPHENLGLIIIDEEHDGSYKQDSPAPRYNGRDTGIMLGAIQSCPVLLGSATPSLESIYNCKTGKYTLIELKQKYHGAEDAGVEIIDTVAERKKRGMRGSLSLKLIFKMEETLGRGEQIIILRSRRSYSPLLQCSECGYIPRCPHCNVSMSYHKSAGKEICHFCGYSRPHTGTCPKCGGRLAGLGAGTQKIEEEVAALFPQARTARLDSDAAQDRKYESEVIRKFGRGDIDILIGTQMVTKGFDFGGLTLVAVIGADAMLAQQDFRADEKAVQTLEQFRGRCGRRGHKGTLIIQTCQPEHPVYRLLCSPGNISEDGFLEERRDFGYPPYCRIIDISVKDSFEDRGERMSVKLCGRLESNGFRFTGPYNPIPGTDAGRHVRNIRVTIPKDNMLSRNKTLLQNILTDFQRKENYTGHISVDVDPA